MFVARLICSAPECLAEAEARAATLEELDALACDCGCGLQVIGWPDADDQPPAELELILLAA